MVLTPQQIEQYHRDGYLVFEELFRTGEVAALLSHLEALVLQRVPCPEGVRMQVEPAVQRGEASAASPMERLRKVEGLVEHEAAFARLAADPRLLDVMQDLIGPDIKLFRDALMMKPPRHGSAKPYHQDSAYWQIDPPDLISVWLALDDATLENGCMRVIPGSHTGGVLEHKHLQDYQVDEAELDTSHEVAVPLNAGGCLFFHSLLLHATAPNHSPHPRRSMIISAMSARSRYTGPDPRPHFPLLRGREYAGAV
jgi:ectoine hydroxylase-related dioxygenase (phytanoyl-CoA dioxygenase family)